MLLFFKMSILFCMKIDLIKHFFCILFNRIKKRFVSSTIGNKKDGHIVTFIELSYISFVFARNSLARVVMVDDLVKNFISYNYLR